MQITGRTSKFFLAVTDSIQVQFKKRCDYSQIFTYCLVLAWISSSVWLVMSIQGTLFWFLMDVLCALLCLSWMSH